MKKMVSLLLVPVLLLCCMATGLAGDFVLVKEGKALPVIVLKKEIASTQKHFIREAEKCGVKFKLVQRAPKGSKILFEVEELPLDKSDSFTIDFPDADTMKITCTSFSAHYAVTHILENVFKVNYVFPHLAIYGKKDINDFPKAVNVVMPKKKFVQKPYSIPIARTIDWRQRMWYKNMGSKDPFLGTHFIPVDVYPVWKYAPDQSWPLEILPILKGKKYIPPKPKKLPLPTNPYFAKTGYDKYWNPCFTNPKAAEIAIENILEIMAKNPKKTEINMGLNDNGGMCECPNCKKAVGGKRNSNNYADWSIPYWTWVNKIAFAVAPKYPNVNFVCGAYREVMDPPPFKLHKNVMVKPCFEIYGMREKKIYDKRVAIMKKWAKVASTIILYDYSYGAQKYAFPRLSYNHQMKIMREFHSKYNLKGLTVESSITTPFEGPKFYQIFQAMKDINSDPEKTLREWCVKAVGPKAAPALVKFYQFWNDYWMGEDIRKTGWYKTIVNIYQQLGEVPTHTFALKKGDLAKLRRLMEEVNAKAGTDQEKRRAKILMQFFEISEAIAQAFMSEYIDPEGKVNSAQDALALLKALPDAIAAQKRFEKHPYRSYSISSALHGAMVANVGLIVPYLKDPAVRKELKRMQTDGRMPVVLRSMSKIWLGAKVKNLVANSSFEEAGPLPTAWGGGKLPGKRSTAYAASGKYSHVSGPRVSLEYVIPVEKSKTYMVIFNAFIPTGSAEGRLNYMLTPREGKKNRDHIRHLGIALSGGAWQTFSSAITIAPTRQDNLALNIWSDNFEKNERVWIDDVRIYCLDDIK